VASLTTIVRMNLREEGAQKNWHRMPIFWKKKKTTKLKTEFRSFTRNLN